MKYVIYNIFLLNFLGSVFGVLVDKNVKNINRFIVNIVWVKYFRLILIFLVILVECNLKKI